MHRLLSENGFQIAFQISGRGFYDAARTIVKRFSA